MDPTDVRAAWDRAADQWERKIGDEGDPFRQHLVNPLIRTWLGRTNAASVLDACCGNGYLFHFLRQYDPELVVDGLDLSPKQVQHAERRVHRGRVILADLSDPETPRKLARTYDLVICTYVFDGIGDLRGALTRCNECLRPQGHLIYTIPHPCFYTPRYFAGKKREQRKQGAQGGGHTEEAVWDYTSESEYDCKLFGILDRVPYYHRPVSVYVQETMQSCFQISDIIEPPTPPELEHYVLTRKGDEIDQRERKKHVLPAYTLTVACRKT